MELLIIQELNPEQTNFFRIPYGIWSPQDLDDLNRIQGKAMNASDFSGVEDASFWAINNALDGPWKQYKVDNKTILTFERVTVFYFLFIM